jgi:hypothetical protein
LEEADEDFELGRRSTPRASRKSREKTQATPRASTKSREKTQAAGRPLKTPTTARLAPLVEGLRRECEKQKSISVEHKMDLDELRDDFRDLRRGLCGKMRRLFVATGHEDLYDAK